MKKLLLIGLVALAVPGVAQAHNVYPVPDCTGNIGISYDNFEPQDVTLTWSATDNGTNVGGGTLVVPGPAGATSATFTPPTAPGEHVIDVLVTFVGGAGEAQGTVTCQVDQPPPPPDCTAVPLPEGCPPPPSGCDAKPPVGNCPPVPCEVTGSCPKPCEPGKEPEPGKPPCEKPPVDKPAHNPTVIPDEPAKKEPKPEITPVVHKGRSPEEPVVLEDALPHTGGMSVALLAGIGLGAALLGLVFRRRLLR